MLEKVEKGELAVGTLVLTHGTEWTELLGYIGFDFVCIDMMVTSLDWHDVAEMVLAAKRYDMTPWVRLSAYPWGSDLDGAMPAQVLRALSLGAEVVLASVNTARQVEQMLHPLSNAHRRFYLQQGGGGRTEAQRRFDEAEPSQVVLPLIESPEAVANLDEILKVPGLRMVGLGMGDLTRSLGHPEDVTHPVVGRFVRDIVRKAREHGIVVSANALAPKRGVDLSKATVDGVSSLWESGVQVVCAPRPPLVLQRFYETTFAALRERLPGKYS